MLRSSWGTPISSLIACSGSSDATSVTKSPVPDSIAPATMRSARSVRTWRRLPMARGVNPRETMPRIRVCWGGSMLSRMIPCMSMDSRGVPSLNRISAVFLVEEKTSGVLDTARMSACLVTAQ